MVNLDVLDTLPEIDILADEGITLEGIQQGMIAKMQSEYETLAGEKLKLVPTDPWRLMLNATSEPLYQLACIINERFKQNFITYMYYDSTRQWGSNFGYFETGEEYAVTTLLFTLSDEAAQEVVIPAGTQVTDGNENYFATDEDLVIAAGETTGEIGATCTESGMSKNGLSIGSLNILSDPIDMIESVSNTVMTAGGRDAYTNDELKVKIINFSSVYSVAGPEAAYEMQAMEYSPLIIDARARADSSATVNLYLVLENATLPDAAFCAGAKEYILGLKRFPDTDKLVVKAPDSVTYTIEATYYISTDKREIEESTKAAVNDAIAEFAADTASHIGKAINPDDLISYAKAAGARRVVLVTPTYQAIDEDEIAICTGITLTYGGLEED